MLEDKDRIFRNLYGRQDWGIAGARARLHAWWRRLLAEHATPGRLAAALLLGNFQSPVATTGEITTPGAPSHRRVFIDGKPAGRFFLTRSAAVRAAQQALEKIRGEAPDSAEANSISSITNDSGH